MRRSMGINVRAAEQITKDDQVVTGGSGVRSRCSQCGGICPSDAMSCPLCGTEAGGETVLDAARRSDTASTRTSIARASLRKINTPSELPLFAERTDEEMDPQTSVLRRGQRLPGPTSSGSSSNDPPTRFLRGIDQHIDLPSGSIVDDYEIEAKLGAGAMGVVYSARHVTLGRRVALKAIAPSMGTDPQALARFEREARTLASLRHPNIVDVYSFGTLPDERSYFTMELLSGSTLDERLERGRLPLGEAVDILEQMARALEAAHAQGIVHRDLKPSNTFLQSLPDEQRRVVLLDFGLVRLAVSDGVEQTASGAMIGTALYMSPEQARSPSVDGRTDIYALGVVAYELVLGCHPFPHARTPIAAITAHLTEEPPQPRTIWPEIPDDLGLLLFSMLAKDPSYRPSLAQVHRVIASVRSPTTTTTTANRGVARAVTARVAPAARSTRGALYARAGITAIALLVGVAIGASALGGSANRGSVPPIQPAKSNAAPLSDRVEVPALVKQAQPSMVAPERVEPSQASMAAPNHLDVRGAQPQVPTTKTPKTKYRGTTPGSVAASPTNRTAAARTETGLSSSEPATEATPEAAGSSDTPPVVDRPVQRPIPLPPKKPPGRNDTINPFAKRGSATR